MGKRKVGALEKVEADLVNLQNKIRRDPISYRNDFQNQYNQYDSLFSVIQESPANTDDNGLVSLHELIDMIAHVADCYPELTKKFPEDLMLLLSKHHAELQVDLREKIVGSLVLLKNKHVITSNTLLDTLFPILVETPSKVFRSLLLQKILSDLRSSNAKTTNHKLNRSTQTYLFNLVASDRESTKGLWAVKITRELWKRQIWTEAKAVEIMKEASLSDNPKVISGGVRFFLGGDKEREDAADESSDDEDIDINQLRHQMQINKKSKKKGRDLKRAVVTVKKKEKKKKNQPHMLNFSALHLLHDPQGFADSLFSKHLQQAKSKLNLEQKLYVLQLVTRLIGLHQLQITSLYSYFLKYLTPRQPSVTTFLASLAQATHQLVPPESITPLVQKIANEFVSEAAASEVACAGLNAIREICVRQPLAMEEPLLQDLIMYRKSKDKGVMMAARGLLSLYREVGPSMLKKRDRGKEAALGLRSGELTTKKFGEFEPGVIEGLELLEKYKEEEALRKKEESGLAEGDEEAADEKRIEEDEEAGWQNWDVEADDSDDSGGWIDVQSDGEDINFSDSEDERASKRRKTAEEAAKSTATAAKATEPPTDAAKEKSPSETLDPEQAAKAQFSKYATSRILTPADLAKLQELRTQSSVLGEMDPTHRKHHLDRAAALRAKQIQAHIDDPLTAEAIEAVGSLSSKKTKEEKIAAAKGDRQEKHMSTTALRKQKKEAAGKSSTNKEKSRQKNFMMTLGKAKAKNRRSLVDMRKSLAGHAARQKRGGNRGNAG
ncbi:SDA1 domain protein [Eremomyces bilateralis CBS 781.70]|uniref:Protein SDA1 n=1 Tax=Eremomyces bilateralis CBS 781.70 TaxID=1392243 RepID=A0A6G1FV79_9PEZI|nr:SDA1 domain protein [Eremomyces bilateralis CBS 781.70]KAF1809561.1 SDA1 domain protein [Eremomyces bilateralis CBS 781.70]